jgi:hypothetical protein
VIPGERYSCLKKRKRSAETTRTPPGALFTHARRTRPTFSYERHHVRHCHTTEHTLVNRSGNGVSEGDSKSCSLALCLLAYLDRINIGYAQLQMRSELNFSDAVYGLGASMFFVGYVLFEVPSNVILKKIGARKTMLRIMLCWGAVSMSTMFVASPLEFYVARFFLGVFEAGFFPGILFYLTL